MFGMDVFEKLLEYYGLSRTSLRTLRYCAKKLENSNASVLALKFLK